MIKMDIQRDRQIDPDALDIEWLEHSNMFDIYSTHLDNMSKKRNELKTDLEIQKEEVARVKADLDLRIRRNPAEFDLDKVTENSIASAILTDSGYQEAQDKYFEIQKELNKAQDLVNRGHTKVNTLIDKKIALQELDKLLLMQYFAAPTSARNLSGEYYKKKEKTKATVKEKIKKVRRKRSRNV